MRQTAFSRGPLCRGPLCRALLSRAARGRPALALATGLLATASVIGVAATGAPALGATTATAPTPRLKLITAQRSITADRFGKQVFLDPGIWVASLNATFRLNVQRASYSKPLTITQVIRTGPGTTRTRRLPHWTLARWQGLKDFAQLTIRNHAGKVVATRKITFCPDTSDPERTAPSSATTSGFPQFCGASDPFQRATVWGITRGWAAEPIQNRDNFALTLGRYQVTETILPAFTRLFHISARDARAKVAVDVVQGQDCCGVNARNRPATAKPLPSLPQVRTLSRAPQDALPDLVALPSWGISTSNTKAAKSFLNFGATVWVGGKSQLDVEGFRKSGSPTMRAYQYFWKNGKIVGRIRAGTMGFDTGKGHNHWHFQQFARYQLLNASKKVAVRSHKVGFCIAPTDAVDLLLPHAAWRSPLFGFGFEFGGQCGSPSALWVREQMPIGWGDTYFQSVAGQSFNITGLPNGTYYVEIIANPERVLHEVTRSNDISLRKVIITGTAGHRQVRVPAFHGIDPEK
jgi:hypothetical protein